MMDVRALDPADIDDAATILREAFENVYRQRGHSPPFPSQESAAWLCRAYLDLDPEGCLVAETTGTSRARWRRLEGVGFMRRRGDVASIGPLAARPGTEPGVGRALMRRMTYLARGTTSLRLFQDSFNPRSFGLYARLGFAVREVAPCLTAERLLPPAAPPPQVRTLSTADLPAVERYDLARCGADRSCDLRLLACSGSALVHAGDGPRTVDGTAGAGLNGYVFFRSLPARVIIGPAVADSTDVLCALVDGIANVLRGSPAVVRCSSAVPILQRCFERGFRVEHVGNLMVAGDYQPPPAQLYALFPESL